MQAAPRSVICKNVIYFLYIYVQTVHMNTPGEEQTVERSPAVILGEHIRTARKERGWTIAELAEKLGRTREWMNRIELGYSEYGDYRPISRAELQSIADCLKDSLEVPTG